MYSKFVKMTVVASTSIMALVAPAPAEDLTSLTVALPVNLCLANWPFYVAAEKGMFAKEGLEVTMEGLDGSSTAIQATLAGRAQVAVTAPADMLSASGAGADLVGFYSFYQYLPFRVLTPEASPIKTLADLNGKTIGISSPGGGDAIYMRSLMSVAGLKEGSYEEFAVGEGNTAASAFNNGTVDAYSASFVEEIIFTSMGIKYRPLASDGYPATAGLLLTATNDYFKTNPKVIEGLGRGLASATKAGLADRDLVVSVCGAVAPQETEDAGFATSVLDGVQPLFTLAAAAGGKYGAVSEDAWAAYRDLIIANGMAGPNAAKTAVSNTYTAAWNQ